ncbi:MAG: MBL fold metallo-hydrolase [Bacillus thermozeamaize]|uniref:MBL fold metallo-hydrolase n=1 Tax=Bacillus thermozeamaize TaxID=230954 RepID=A0A1Y3PPX4_9BACI|nr:MAG: MBL fold metallo-hydrolase [Bacillus thermozeamaize]
MTQQQPLELGHGISMIDLHDLGLPNRTGCYVFREELTLIETGPSRSIPYLLQGLEQLNIRPEEIRYIIVTHIHLDHAGGAGLLIQHCTNAKVIVHPRGARHLVDPSRLIAGAKMVYGDKFDELFAPILPVPEERILIKGEGDTLTIGPGRTLRFLDTPGHALHHFSIYDPVSHGVFCGDTAGIRYSHLEADGIPFFLPVTSPNQFDPEAMLASIERFKTMNLSRLYYGHYGMTTQVDEAIRQVVHWLPRFLEESEKIFTENAGTVVQLVDLISQRLMDIIRKELSEKGIQDSHPVYQILMMDAQVSAMGLVDYLSKKSEKAKA